MKKDKYDRLITTCEFKDDVEECKKCSDFMKKYYNGKSNMMKYILWGCQIKGVNINKDEDYV